jgi:hypothetical protein
MDETEIERQVLSSVSYHSAGPSKLPEVGKGLGKTFKSFQSAAKVCRIDVMLFCLYIFGCLVADMNGLELHQSVLDSYDAFSMEQMQQILCYAILAGIRERVEGGNEGRRR